MSNDSAAIRAATIEECAKAAEGTVPIASGNFFAARRDQCAKAAAARKIENVGQGAEVSYVFECSNPECGMLWDNDPRGHCPACIKESGHGWSCITRSVTPLKVFCLHAHRASRRSRS